MDLMKQLELVSTRWGEVRNAEKAEGQARTFCNLSKELGDLADAVQNVRAQESALGPAKRKRSVAWKGVLVGLSKLEEGLAGDALVDVTKDMTRVRPQCQAVVKDWDAQNMDDWRAWCEQHKGVELDSSVLDKLRPVAEAVVQKLQSLLRERVELTRKPRAGEGDVERIRNQGKRVEAALAEMGFDDEAVRDGFKKLVVGGLGLDELSSPSSPLRAWLESKGLLASCKVRLS